MLAAYIIIEVNPSALGSGRSIHASEAEMSNRVGLGWAEPQRMRVEVEEEPINFETLGEGEKTSSGHGSETEDINWDVERGVLGADREVFRWRIEARRSGNETEERSELLVPYDEP